jgi:hypothetical protein
MAELEKDEIGIDLNINNLDKRSEDLKSFEELLQKIEDSLNANIRKGSEYATKFGDQLLGLRRSAGSLSTQLTNLAKLGDVKGFESAAVRSENLIKRLSEVQSLLRDLDVKTSTQKEPFKTDIEQAQKYREELVRIQREYIELNQAKTLLNLSGSAPSQPVAVDYNSPLLRQTLADRKALATLDQALVRIATSDKEGIGALQKRAKDASDEARKLETQIKRIETEALKTTDPVVLEKIEDRALKARNRVEELRRTLIDIDKQVNKVVQPPVAPDVAGGYASPFLKNLLTQRNTIAQLENKFTTLGKERFGTEAIQVRAGDVIRELGDVDKKLKDIEQFALKTTDKNTLRVLRDEATILIQRIEELRREFNELARVEKTIPRLKDTPVANELTDPFLKQTYAQRNTIASLERQYARLEESKRKGIDPIKKASTDAIKELSKIDAELKSIEKTSQSTTDVKLLRSLDLQAKDAANRVEKLKRELLELQRAERLLPQAEKFKPPTLSQSPIFQIGRGLGVPFAASGLGTAAAVGSLVYGAGRALDYTQIAIERASEATRANRLLASSATEAGLAYDVLAQKNRKFAEAVGLSEVAATITTAKIAQLATRTQGPENIDRLIKGFSDLGAARGLDATELQTIIQQIITGQDEGYKKLLLPNPSQLYAIEAKKTGRSVESFSAVERTQIFEREFLKKSDLFNGAAEARMASLDGRAAKLNASLENVKNSWSLMFASNVDVSMTIDELTKSLGGLNAQLDNLADKVKRGQNIDQQIKDVAAPGIIAYTKAALQTFQSGLNTAGAALINVGTLGYASDINKDLKDRAMKRAEFAQEYVNPNIREDYYRQQINAQIRNEANLQKTADERRIQLQTEIAEEEKNKRASTEQKRIEDIFRSRSRSSVDQITKALDELNRYSAPLAKVPDEEEIKKKVQERFQTLDRANYAGQSMGQILNNLSIQVRKEAQAKLDVENLPLFSEDVLIKLKQQGAKDLSDSVADAYRLVLQNPEIKIEGLLAELGKIKGDKRLFPEVQEALVNQVTEAVSRAQEKIYQKILTDPDLKARTLQQTLANIRKDTNLLPDVREDTIRDAERRQQEMARAAQDLATRFKDVALNGFDQSNPLVRTVFEVGTAFESTRRQFAIFGDEFAMMAGKIAENSAGLRASFQLFTSTDVELKLRQQARRLEALPDFLTNRFEQRLSAVAQAASTIGTDVQLSREIGFDLFLASEQYKPSRSDNPLKGASAQYFKSTYGEEEFRNLSKGLGKVAPKDRGRFIESYIRAKEAASAVGAFYAIDLQGTGVLGAEEAAKQVLATLPGRDELQTLLSGGEQSKRLAQGLLGQRAQANQILRAANIKKFENFIATQKFNELNVKDAEERIRNLSANGTALPDRLQLDQLLNILGEIPESDLTPTLRIAKIRALNQRAAVEAADRDTAIANAKLLNGVLSTMKTQLEGDGLKVKADKSILDVNVKVPVGSLVTSNNQRPNAASVGVKYE